MYASSAVCGAARKFTQIQASARVKLKLVSHEAEYSTQRSMFMKGFGSMAKSFALLVIKEFKRTSGVIERAGEQSPGTKILTVFEASS